MERSSHLPTVRCRVLLVAQPQDTRRRMLRDRQRSIPQRPPSGQQRCQPNPCARFARQPDEVERDSALFHFEAQSTTGASRVRYKETLLNEPVKGWLRPQGIRLDVRSEHVAHHRSARRSSFVRFSLFATCSPTARSQVHAIGGKNWTRCSQARPVLDGAQNARLCVKHFGCSSSRSPSDPAIAGRR